MKTITNKTAHVITTLLISLYAGNMFYRVVDRGVQLLIRVTTEKTVSLSFTSNGWITVKYVIGKEIVKTRKYRNVEDVWNDISWMYIFHPNREALCTNEEVDKFTKVFSSHSRTAVLDYFNRMNAECELADECKKEAVEMDLAFNGPTE